MRRRADTNTQKRRNENNTQTLTHTRLHRRICNGNMTHMRSPNYLPFNYIRSILYSIKSSRPYHWRTSYKKNSQPPHPSPHFPSTSTSTKYLFVTLVFMIFFFTLTLYHSFPLTAHCLFNMLWVLSQAIFIITAKKYWFIFSHAHVHAHTALSGSLSGRTGIGLYFNLSAVLARQVQIPTDVNNKLTFLCANFSLWHTLNCVFISSTAL